MSIGQRFAEVRVDHGLTQVQMSEKLKMSRGNVAKIELELIRPTSDVIIKMYEIFKVDISWFLLGTGKKYIHQPSLEVSEPKSDYGNCWQKLAEVQEERIKDLKTMDELRKEIDRLKVFERMVAEQPAQTSKKS